MDKGNINLNIGEHKAKLEAMAEREQRTMTVILQRLIDQEWQKQETDDARDQAEESA